MSEPISTLEMIEQLKNSQNNIKVFTAVPLGVLLCIYFFTFATLIDRGMTGALLFELVSAVMFILAIVFINSLSFELLKLRYRKSSAFNQLLSCLSAKDMTHKPDEIQSILSSRHIT